MTTIEVDTLLHNYRANVARYGTLSLTADKLSRKLKAEEANALAGEALHAQQYSGMPHGNKVNKPVEDLVLNFTAGHLPEQLKLWQAEAAALEREMVELKTDICYVDAWLGALTDKERTVITETLLNDRSMREVAFHSHKLFAYPLSADSIRGIKRQALRKIYDIAR